MTIRLAAVAAIPSVVGSIVFLSRRAARSRWPGRGLGGRTRRHGPLGAAFGGLGRHPGSGQPADQDDRGESFDHAPTCLLRPTRTDMTAMTSPAVLVTGGVDTHRDIHVAAALDQVGGLLGTATFATTPTGYRALLAWLVGFGPVAAVGVEGTGSYGGRPGPAPERQRGAGGRGWAPEPAGPAPARQDRRRRCDRRGPRRVVRGRDRRSEVPRRAGGGAAGVEDGAAQRNQGPHLGAEPAARLGADRPRGPAGQVA